MKNTLILCIALILVTATSITFVSANSEAETLGKNLTSIVTLILSSSKYKETEKNLVKSMIKNCSENNNKAVIKEACGAVQAGIGEIENNIQTQMPKIPVNPEKTKELETKCLTMSCSIEELRKLVEQGADVNANKDGQFGSAFTLAIQLGNRDLVKFMVAHGADTNPDHYALEAKTVVEVWNKVEELINETDTEDKKIWSIFYWVADNIEYDGYGLENGEMIADWLTTYQQRMGVCDGYARLFDIMLRLAGVKEVKYVSGTAGIKASTPYGDHARNKVGKYYYDTTRNLYKMTEKEMKGYDIGRKGGTPTDIFLNKQMLTNKFTRHIEHILTGEVKNTRFYTSWTRDQNFVTSRYPGCNENDVQVGDFIIASCNVGTNMAGTIPDSFGEYFDWYKAQNACADGYHLPSKQEFDQVITFFSILQENEGFQSKRMIPLLNLPVAGRSTAYANVYKVSGGAGDGPGNRWGHALYRTSDPGYYLGIEFGKVYTKQTLSLRPDGHYEELIDNRDSLGSVRCFKD